MAKGITVSFEQADILVENKNQKGVNIIRIQAIGNKKEHILKFEVLYLIM